MNDDIEKIRKNLKLNMTLAEIIALLGQPRSHIGPYYVWERPEGRYELTVQGGQLFSMNSVPKCIEEKPKTSQTGKTLFQAAQDGDIAAINDLLDCGADVNARDHSGNTALLAAVCYGEVEAVELLISKGADVNAVCEGGYTPLRMAATTSIKERLQTILKAHGAIR